MRIGSSGHEAGVDQERRRKSQLPPLLSNFPCLYRDRRGRCFDRYSAYKRGAGRKLLIQGFFYYYNAYFEVIF